MVDDYNVSVDQMNWDDDAKELVILAMHELRNINKIIRNNADEMTRLLAHDNFNPGKIREMAEAVFDSSYSASLWLDICDFELSPTFFTVQEKGLRNIHGKLTKAIRAFRRIAEPKQLKIKLHGTAMTQIECYPIVEILPYVLIDNAVKYAPKNSEIDIEIWENGQVCFSVSSLGPSLMEGEIREITKKSFRGENARRFQTQGLGRGLSIAQLICDMHNAKLELHSDESSIEFNHVPFAQFTATVKFMK